jgi:DeoR/GlpR family transcriptional regulator of sugar metabolism
MDLRIMAEFIDLMRKSGEWMTLWDDRILEVIRSDDDKIGRVGELAEHEYIRVSQSTVSRRCKKLAEKGLLRQVGDGVYLLTDRGEGYLDGKISTYENEPDKVPQNDDENSISSPSSPESP